MQEPARKARNSQRMTELYPWFAEQLALVISELEGNGLRPRIQDAWRSPEDQLNAFNSGHSKLKFGFHNVTSASGAKEALAVDLLDDNAPLNPGTPYVLRVTAAAERHGLATGARWGLPSKLSKAVDAAIALQDWKASVKVGWDPVHVEPGNFTPEQAAAGERPDDA
jgi:hypothetical protein